MLQALKVLQAHKALKEIPGQQEQEAFKEYRGQQERQEQKERQVR